MSLDLVLSCGELSGDVALSQLLSPLKGTLDANRVGGVWGPHTSSLGLVPGRNLDGLQVMGFTAVLKSLPRIRQHAQWLSDLIMQSQPKVILCCDYPGFHLSLAKKLRREGFRGRIIQYVCPSIWAWKTSRLDTLEAYFDEVWGILPFEAPYFSNRKVIYRYVGNPSLQQAHSEQTIPMPDSNQDSSSNVIGLFPGSRPSEIKRHLPILLKAAHQVDQKAGRQKWMISLAHEALREETQLQLHQLQLDIDWIMPSGRMQAMRKLRAALAVSGTVCLELALRKVPTIAIYETGWINYFLAKYLLRLNLPAYTLPNLLLGRLALPEVMGPGLDEQDIASVLVDWLQSSLTYQKAIESLNELWQIMWKSEQDSMQLQALQDLTRWIGKS